MVAKLRLGRQRRKGQPGVLPVASGVREEADSSLSLVRRLEIFAGARLSQLSQLYLLGL